MTRHGRHSRPWLLAAGLAPLAALAAAIAAAILLHAAGHASQGHGTAPASAAPTAPRRAAAQDEMPQAPQAALSGLRWASYDGVELPSSPQAGPRDSAGGLASGYADTPLGALVAAVNIAVRANAQWGPGVFVPVIRSQVTGPDAAALLASCHAAYRQAAGAAYVSGGQPLGRADVTEEAFRWVTYAPSGATVDLVSAGPGGGGRTVRAVTRIQVTWDGADWKVIAPLGGDWASAASVLTSLTGYTLFPGQG